MPTFTQMIAHAQRHADEAKHLAALWREESRAVSRALDAAHRDEAADPAALLGEESRAAYVRLAAARAAAQAAAAGRDVERWKFEAALDRWIDRYARYEVGGDPLLESLAPRWPDGQVDQYWLAAAHLRRDGISAPLDWHSPTGEPLAPEPRPESHPDPR
jgi:hypothetical protein